MVVVVDTTVTPPPSVSPVPVAVTLGSLSLTGVDSDGTEWVVSQLDGWSDSPASTIQLTQRPYGPGGWSSQSPQLGSRVITLGGCITATSTALMLAALDRLDAAAVLDATALNVADGGRVQFCTVARQDAVLITRLNAFSSSYSVQLVAADPRKYGTVLSGSTALPASSGGLTVPFTVPFSIDATRTTGRVVLTSPGDTSGPVTARIMGPCSGTTSITHTSSLGTQVWSMDLTLAAGEWVIVELDPDRQRVLAQGQASRAGYVTARGWSSLDPGLNTWNFTSSGQDEGAVLRIEATPAWQ